MAVSANLATPDNWLDYAGIEVGKILFLIDRRISLIAVNKSCCAGVRHAKLAWPPFKGQGQRWIRNVT
jgi:hypothetical protein